MGEVFENISDYLQPVLPVSWHKVCLYAEMTETYSEVFYYCFVDEQKAPIQCYNLTSKFEISEEDIDKAIAKIADELKNQYNCADDKWSVMTLILFANGKFEVAYDYSDLSDGSYDFKENWKKKYLL